MDIRTSIEAVEKTSTYPIKRLASDELPTKLSRNQEVNQLPDKLVRK